MLCSLSAFFVVAAAAAGVAVVVVVGVVVVIIIIIVVISKLYLVSNLQKRIAAGFFEVPKDNNW